MVLGSAWPSGLHGGRAVSGGRCPPQTSDHHALCDLGENLGLYLCSHTQSVTSEMPAAPRQLPKRCVLLVVGRQR